MRLAVLADIHGNLHALDAVLVDVAAHAPDRVLVLGDHASGPLDPAGALDRLMALSGDVRCLRGNHDRWLVETPQSAMGPSDAYAASMLSPDHLEWLKHLPPALAFDDVFACHGTPASDTTYWLEEVLGDGAVRRRPRRDVEAYAAEGAALGADTATLLLCAHTHLPRCMALSDGRLLVNPGSVGLPAYDDDEPFAHVMEAGTPHAAYALLEDRRDAGAPVAWSVTHRLVPYDAEAAAKLADANDRPDWAAALRNGWISA